MEKGRAFATGLEDIYRTMGISLRFTGLAAGRKKS